jgi:hypothetical protein
MTTSLTEELKNDFPLLIEAGFVAVNQRDEDSAKKLFKAAQLLEPESTAPRIGFGFIALNKLELDIAQKEFNDVLKKDTEHQLARAFLGITLCFNPKTRAEGKKLIEEAMSKTDDPHVKNLGSISLEWLKKDFEGKR